MKADFAKAKTNSLKAELAKRLFELGKGTRDDAAVAYVQLRRAIDLAAESAQVELAFEIIGTLAARFDVDELAEKEKSLATAGRLAKNAQEFHQLTEIWVLLTRERSSATIMTWRRGPPASAALRKALADAVFGKLSSQARKTCNSSRRLTRRPSLQRSDWPQIGLMPRPRQTGADFCARTRGTGTMVCRFGQGRAMNKLPI